MDRIPIEVLEDGTISITTDAISGQNHQSADEFLKDLAKVAGGTVQIKDRPQKASHHHHNHGHQHGQQKQSVRGSW